MRGRRARASADAWTRSCRARPRRRRRCAGAGCRRGSCCTVLESVGSEVTGIVGGRRIRGDHGSARGSATCQLPIAQDDRGCPHIGARALVARHRPDGRGLRQAHRRVVNSFVEFVPGTCTCAERRAAGGRCDPRGRRRTTRVQHHRPSWTTGCDGPRRHAVTAALARPDAGHIEYMVNAMRRRHGLHLELRKDHHGMLMAALTPRIPACSSSGGAMRAAMVTWAGETASRSTPWRPSWWRSTRSHGRAEARGRRSACPTCGSCAGMFTANSMNCLTEALGLALPGNGTVVATHADRRSLFLEAGRRVMELTRRWITSRATRAAKPRGIATYRGLRERPCASTWPWAARPTPCCTARRGPLGASAVQHAGHRPQLALDAALVRRVALGATPMHIEDVHRGGRRDGHPRRARSRRGSCIARPGPCSRRARRRAGALGRRAPPEAATAKLYRAAAGRCAHHRAVLAVAPSTRGSTPTARAA